MGNLKRNNGSVIEKAHLNTDKKKYDEGYNRIFGNKDKLKDTPLEVGDRVYATLDFPLIKRGEIRTISRIRKNLNGCIFYTFKDDEQNEYVSSYFKPEIEKCKAGI